MVYFLFEEHEINFFDPVDMIDLVLQRGNRYEPSFLRTPKKDIPNIYHY